ncbi:hypothetical protein [Lysinibacillus sp. NPDC047702]|uniref:hypothetical protein n=1 Tax=unclassified Lysinibacillus TaxID=2636778 RepID=UPI003D0133E6
MSMAFRCYGHGSDTEPLKDGKQILNVKGSVCTFRLPAREVLTKEAILEKDSNDFLENITKRAETFVHEAHFQKKN